MINLRASPWRVDDFLNLLKTTWCLPADAWQWYHSGHNVTFTTKIHVYEFTVIFVFLDIWCTYDNGIDPMLLLCHWEYKTAMIEGHIWYKPGGILQSDLTVTYRTASSECIFLLTHELHSITPVLTPPLTTATPHFFSKSSLGVIQSLPRGLYLPYSWCLYVMSVAGFVVGVSTYART